MLNAYPARDAREADLQNRAIQSQETKDTQLLSLTYGPQSSVLFTPFSFYPLWAAKQPDKDSSGRINCLPKKILQSPYSSLQSEYHVTVYPAKVKAVSGYYLGKEVDFVPGTKEMIVLEALIFFARRNGKMSKEDNNSRLMITFSVNEIRELLKLHKHTYSHNELIFSLKVLRRTNYKVEHIPISKWRKRTTSEFCIIDNMHLPENKCANTSYVIFNSIISDGVKQREYRYFDFKAIMSYKNVLAKYIHKLISCAHTNFGEHMPCVISLRDVFIMSGYTLVTTRWKSNTDKVEAALDEMVDKGLIQKYNPVPKRKNHRTIDVEYTIYGVTSGDHGSGLIKELKKAHVAFNAIRNGKVMTREDVIPLEQLALPC